MPMPPAALGMMFTTGQEPEGGDSKFRESRPHRPEKSGMDVACPAPILGDRKIAPERSAVMRIRRLARGDEWGIRTVSLHPVKREERPQSCAGAAPEQVET